MDLDVIFIVVIFREEETVNEVVSCEVPVWDRKLVVVVVYHSFVLLLDNLFEEDLFINLIV